MSRPEESEGKESQRQCFPIFCISMSVINVGHGQRCAKCGEKSRTSIRDIGKFICEWKGKRLFVRSGKASALSQEVFQLCGLGFIFACFAEKVVLFCTFFASLAMLVLPLPLWPSSPPPSTRPTLVTSVSTSDLRSARRQLLTSSGRPPKVKKRPSSSVAAVVNN